VKEAQFISILAHPRLDFCSEVVTNQDKKLVLAYSLRGANATSFCKDLATEFTNWQINNPEQLHQKILDLLFFTRQKNLEIELAASWLYQEQIVFVTYSGQAILQRNGQIRPILSSSAEVKIILGPFRENDRIILVNQAGATLAEEILTSANLNAKENSLEKIVSELSLMQEEQRNPGNSLAILSYLENIVPNAEKPKFEVKKLLLCFAQLKKVATKIYYFIKKIPSFLKKIYIWLKNQNKKKLLISLIIFLTLLGGVFGTFTLLNNQQQKIVHNIQNKISTIDADIKNIDQLVLQQPLIAREKAQKSLQAVEALKKEKNNRESLKLIDEQIQKLENIINQIAGENSLDRLSIAFNLDNFLGKKIEIEGEQIFILENSGQEILKINTDLSQEKLSLDNNQKIRNFTVSDDKLFVLSNGIQMLDLQKNEQKFKEIKTEGESDKNAEYLSSFGPYLYLVNKEKRNIYRYYYNTEKLSEPIGWLIDKQGINFENISDLIIDGDLWLGDKSGRLLKFNKGYTADFQITGLSKPLNSTISISSSEDNNTLAILEKQNKRLIILTKDGQLISEIKSNELAGVSSIVIKADGKKVYALSGSVVYEVEI